MQLVQGDSLEKMKDIPDESVDLVLTDPPYGLYLRKMAWDKTVPSHEIWKECLRVLKPGAFCLTMSAVRQDVLSRMVVNIEDAGFKTDFTSIYWYYKNGLPKSLSVKNLINRFSLEDTALTGEIQDAYTSFQLKPALEVILCSMKPISTKNYIQQAIANGKGVTWINDCRIPYRDEKDVPRKRTRIKHSVISKKLKEVTGRAGISFNKIFRDDLEDNPERMEYKSHSVGRYPANLLVSNDAMGDDSRFYDLDKWADENDVPLDKFPFFCVPKPNQKEKTKGVVKSKARHPAVKPVKLMSYLIKMFSREGDTVLDPFMGSGTTGIACSNLGRNFVGIELKENFFELAEERIGAHANRELDKSR